MFIGLIFEFLNPGAVAPGLVGAISLLVALYALAYVPINYAGCLAQRSFPLLADVVLNAALLKDRVSDFELSMRFTIEPVCVPGTIKLMHCGLADRAKEGPWQRSILNQLLGAHR